MPLQENDPMAAITAILNATKDQKSTSTTSSNISSAGVNSIIQQILQGSQGLGAVAAGQHVSGGYNSTVQQQQLNDLITRTAGEVAQKQAGTTTRNNKQAPLSGKLLNLVSTLGSVRSLGKTTGLTDKLTELYDGVSNNIGASQIASGVSDGSLAAGAQPADFAAFEDALGTGDAAASAVGSDAAASAADATAAATTAGIDAGATNAATDAAIASAGAGSGADVAGLTALDSAAASEGAGASGTGAAEIGSDIGAVSSAASLADAGSVGAASASADLAALGPYGLAAAAALYLGTTYGSQIDDHVLQPVGDAIGDLGTSIDDEITQPILGAVKGVTGGWIVCTELVKQNRMPKRFYIAGLRRFNSYDDRGKQGYYYWAVAAVLHLRRNPNSLYSRFLCWVMNQRAEYIAASCGVQGAVDSPVGALTYYGLYAFCWILSRTLARKSIDWSERVYGVPHGN